MLHTLENEHLTCTIESKGAEIRSLKDKITGREYIWQIDPSIWGSSSPVLFPAIGNIKGNRIDYSGQSYGMTKHGIIRNNDNLDFTNISESSCSFTLTSSYKTAAQYPFQFAFTVVFSLNHRSLKMRYMIQNEDSIPLFFTCGGHTAYDCPLNNFTKLTDYVIEFPERVTLKSYTLAKSGLISSQERLIPTSGNLLILTDTLFNEDALIFSNIDYDWVRLRKKNEEKGILVKFTDYPNLALWSKPGADFVCIEPWLGLPDHENEPLDITQKKTYKKIEPGKTFSIAIDTRIE